MKPSPEQTHIEKCFVLVSEWFKDHKASRSIMIEPCTGCQITTIDWRRPGTSSYSIWFIITRNCVIVTGDLGDAIYGFGCELTFPFLRQCDYHYFAGKCCASETGRQYTQKIPGVKHPVINVRAIAHYVGLQQAIKQLEAV